MQRAIILLVLLLAAVGAARAEDFVAQQQAHTCVDNLRRIQQALELYKVDYGVYPDHLDDLMPKYMGGMPLCPVGASDTYSGGYIGKKKTYIICCVGLHHKAAGMDQNLPAIVNGTVVPDLGSRTSAEQDWDALTGAIARRNAQVVEQVAGRSDMRDNIAGGVPALDYALALAVSAQVRCRTDAQKHVNTEIIQTLMRAGAQVNSVVERETTLNCALLTEDARLVEMLLDRGADPNLQNGRGQSALMSIIVGWRVHDRSRLLTLVDLLMVHHANPDQKSNKGGLTPRQAAHQNGLVDVEALLGRRR